ncbi:hypothetical protein FVP33_11060 [Lacisediminihabitans profunda]|uniref:Secreted protein n=2 Tax=Lacisediminihabitans profunda TaxID=2594790 RepID=A0A5C8UMT2_9MICO|nr:hypothetical protein FVP33_11060 [Lacisediminihabitans profunda]
MPAARVRSAIAAFGLVVVLSGCAGRPTADGPASVPSTDATGPASTGSASSGPGPSATDDLGAVQADLDQAASAQRQSEDDLANGDTASRQGDDH